MFPLGEPERLLERKIKTKEIRPSITPVIPATQEVEMVGWWSEAGLGKNVHPIWKTHQKQKNGSGAQVMEYLPKKPVGP
jgi:hypothetical protein